MAPRRRYYKEDPMLAEETYADPALVNEEEVVSADSPGVQMAEIDAEIAGLNLELEQCLAQADALNAQIEALTAERDGIDADAAAEADATIAEGIDGAAADDMALEGEDDEEIVA